MTESSSTAFVFEKGDLTRTEFVTRPVPEPAEGQVVLEVERFAMTANNITYAVIGEAFGYSKFFPAPEGRTCFPSWGIARVIRSRAADVKEGTRVFGYVPMGSHLVVAPAANPQGFADTSPHRAGFEPLYNQYWALDGSAMYEGAHEDLWPILWILYSTDFVLEQFFAANAWFGARALVVSSASSRTALGLAHRVRHAGTVPELVGLTSAEHEAFVKRVGYYDRVVRYDDVASLAPDVPVVYVDVAGDAAVTARVHHHLGDAIRHSMFLGLTHWRAFQGIEPATPLPGPAPALFFAPAHVTARTAQWGMEGFLERFAPAWREYCDAARSWLEVAPGEGRHAVEEAYRANLEGRAHPSHAHLLRL